MKQGLQFIPLSPENQDVYSKVARRSYVAHYTHLWRDRDPSPYLDSSFGRAVVAKELKDPGLDHFIVYRDTMAVGIIKLVRSSAVATHSPQDALLLEKLYLLNEATGQGIGRAALEFVEAYGVDMGKKLLWLDTMQEGPALGFYLRNGFRVLEEKTLHFTEVPEDKKPMYILVKPLGSPLL